MDEAARMKEALFSYAAVQPLHSMRPGDLQRDLRSIAGSKHRFRRMIKDERCIVCRHPEQHEVHQCS